jgi:hypothetical protein
VVDDRAPRGLDLARRHPARLLRLQTEFAERKRRAGLRMTFHAAALELAVLQSFRLQHG